MPKPSSVFGWLKVGVEPSAGKKTSGYAPGEKIPAQVLNWAWKMVSDWIAYLNTLTDEALTWTNYHVFESVMTIGSQWYGDVSSAHDPKITIPVAPSSTAALTLLLDAPIAIGGGKHLRFYAGSGSDLPSLSVTLNAEANADGSTWDRDAAGDAYRAIFRLSPTPAVSIACELAAAANFAGFATPILTVNAASGGTAQGAIIRGGHRQEVHMSINDYTSTSYYLSPAHGDGGILSQYMRRKKAGELTRLFFRCNGAAPVGNPLTVTAYKSTGGGGETSIGAVTITNPASEAEITRSYTGASGSFSWAADDDLRFRVTSSSGPSAIDLRIEADLTEDL